MNKTVLSVFSVFLIGGLAACASTRPSSAGLNYYHGQRIPSEFFRVVRSTATEIEFEIRVKFRQDHLYHLILDGNTPLAEGWFPTTRAEQKSYGVVLKAKPGVHFVSGKLYRLCIGEQSPELISTRSKNYRCTADYEFVLD